jgi:hypothetical protein
MEEDMSKTLLVAVTALITFTICSAGADAKKAKKHPTEQKCKPYGDADSGSQMCGYIK